MDLRAVRGMNDILPHEIGHWQQLEAIFRDHAALHGFAEIRTPLIEHTSLFSHQIGEATDVVEKEMYSFERHDDSLTVRPEGTAGTARAYVEHNIHAKEAVTRWYYMGPMFRGERPAKGRYRQFHQAGCEHFGDGSPAADVAMIEFITSLFQKLKIGAFAVHINSIGSENTRAKFRQALVEHFLPHQERLSDDSKRRLEKNPLRILDSKDPRDREICLGAPSILDVLDDADRAHHEQVLQLLDATNIHYVVDPHLVRGLDYYTRTLFEFRTLSEDLGAQNAIAGGGRYDNMIRDLGGPSVAAIGFAMGIERILAMMPDNELKPPQCCLIAPLSPTCLAKSFLLARTMRNHNIATEVDGRGGRLKAMLRRADTIGARFCLILGDTELEKGIVSVKDLVEHTQVELPIESVARILSDRLLTAPIA